MILAAGMGTRLGPLTKDKPKALVEYNGKTLLEIVIRRLIHHGFRDIIINVHHFADQVVSFTESKKNFSVNIQFSDETDLLLDTGGGIEKAMWFFRNDPVLVHNVDIYTDLNLEEFYDYNNDNGYLATLAVKARTSTRPFLRTENGILCGWQNLVTGETVMTRDETNPERIAYSGIAVFSSAFVKMLPDTGKYNLIPEMLKISRTHDINLFEHTGIWKDMGKPESYL